VLKGTVAGWVRPARARIVGGMTERRDEGQSLFGGDHEVMVAAAISGASTSMRS
jgi:hypothetical protein